MEDTVEQVDSRTCIRGWGLRRDLWRNRLIWNTRENEKVNK